MSIHIFLNGARGVPVVRAAVAAGQIVEAAYVPAGAGAKPFADAARACGVAVVEVADPNDAAFVASVRQAGRRLGVVAGYPTIFRRPLIEAPELGTINLHGGRLPAYRGGSPLNWQIINGEVEAGISVIRMDEGIDTGPVLASASIELGPDDDIGVLHERANALFPGLAVEAVARRLAGDAGDPQDEAKACYWHQRNDADGRIDWRSMTAATVRNLVRGVTRPYPGAFSDLDGRRLRIFACEILEPPMRGVPGRIVHRQGLGPFVLCADRAVLLSDYAFEDGEAGRLPHGASFG